MNVPAGPHVAVLARSEALRPVFFRPMVRYAVDLAMAIPHASARLVLERGERELREQCRDYPELALVRQEAGGPVGAARALRPLLEGLSGDLLILGDDRVLMTPRSATELVALHRRAGADCTVGRDAPGAASRTAACCFRVHALLRALDAPIEASQPVSRLAEGMKTAEYVFRDPLETLAIEGYGDVWRAESALRERRNAELMSAGVWLQDPRTTLVDLRSRVGSEVKLEGGVTIVNSVLEARVAVESHCRIADSRIGAGTRVRHGSVLEDARVGRGVVIGCGFIACGSSGRLLKQETVIEDGVFIGAASQAVAPVTLGAGSFVATGTSVTEDVPPDSFVVSRGRQVTKPGYAKKYARSKGTTAHR